MILQKQRSSEDMLMAVFVKLLKKSNHQPPLDISLIPSTELVEELYRHAADRAAERCNGYRLELDEYLAMSTHIEKEVKRANDERNGAKFWFAWKGMNFRVMYNWRYHLITTFLESRQT